MILANKIVLVTGGSGGWGSAVIERFREEGARLVLTYRSEKGIANFPTAVRDKPDDILLVKADLGIEKDVRGLYDKINRQYGSLHVLCNLAGGFVRDKPLQEVSLEEWNRVLSFNLTTCFLLCREALKIMKGNDYGRIINISARPGVYPEPNRGAYGVSKAGVAYLTRMLGKETHRTGITVNAIAPSIILTEANKEWGEKDEMKYWVTPAQLTDTMLFLCKEQANPINGTVIDVFGDV
jgi:NAD(P)-dependent dehydrogenase (short-subunit alcohol dehydrogenase family)